ncbi:MAG TPA: phosphopentomutase [Chthoniobacterales bacterium]|jgi:phosphopentomutase
MRALLIVLDSVGIGSAPDAAQYGDIDANTLGHIFARCRDTWLPNLCALGLPKILDQNYSWTRKTFALPHLASFGKMEERSAGKDTTTGHWEIAGAILDKPFSTFLRFPYELVEAIEQEVGVKFIGNYACSGTTILEELGAQHVDTGNPILYTSADSVLQIAAHEEIISLEKLYDVCRIARRHADRFRIGRVIARPFTGSDGKFSRTPNRHDFSMQPPRTVLNAIADAGFPTIGVGKISDIFAGQGITESHPATSNREGMACIDELWSKTERGLIFCNLVDFDMIYGHRRDVNGYAMALSEFDEWLGPLIDKISPEDLLIITADHGNDPTFRGTDHTRERVPLFVMHNRESRDLGTRTTFADVAASLGEFFELPEPWPVGTSFLRPRRSSNSD